MAERTLKDGAAMVALAKRLSGCPEVVRYSDRQHDEPSTLAHALADLEESFETVRVKLLPKLLGPSSGTHADYQVLLDIGEELRHVLYHIEDCRFYRYLQPNRAEVPDP